MFGLGAATRIYLAPGATDMRKGFNGLYGLVRDQLLCDHLSGHLFLFSNAQRNRLKVLFWDTTGLWVCAKKLEKGCFHWPTQSDSQGKIVLSHEEFAMEPDGRTGLRCKSSASFASRSGDDVVIGLPSLQMLDGAPGPRIWLAAEATDMRCGV